MSIDPVLPITLTLALCTVLCMHAAGQSPAPTKPQDDAKAKALLARIDQARLGQARAGKEALRIEGSYAVTFGKQTKPVAQGAFHEIYLGNELARQVTEMGPMGRMERGAHRDVVWEVDPTMGAKVRRGAQAGAQQRYFAWLRGAPVGPLYASARVHGEAKVGEVECTVLELTSIHGPKDLLYVDQHAVVHGLDIELPTPESADAAFGMDDSMRAHLTFTDWRKVGDLAFPYQRTLQMGPATVASTCTSIRLGADAKDVAEAAFVPPKAVLDKQREPAPTPAFDAAGKPLYQIIERPAQTAATIRTKCKLDEVSKTLGIVLPEVMQHITAHGGKLMGPPFTIYHSFGPDEIDLEAGMPVQGKIEENERVKNTELPAGKTVTVWHVGPYDKLGAAHDALQAHLKAEKLEARGGPYEIYWTDPGMVPDPAKWKTQLFAPIK